MQDNNQYYDENHNYTDTRQIGWYIENDETGHSKNYYLCPKHADWRGFEKSECISQVNKFCEDCIYAGDDEAY